MKFAWGIIKQVVQVCKDVIYFIHYIYTQNNIAERHSDDSMDDPRRSSTKPDDGWFSKFTLISIERNENHKGQYQVIIARSTFFPLDDFGTAKNFFPTTPGEALWTTTGKKKTTYPQHGTCHLGHDKIPKKLLYRLHRLDATLRSVLLMETCHVPHVKLFCLLSLSSGLTK